MKFTLRDQEINACPSDVFVWLIDRAEPQRDIPAQSWHWYLDEPDAIEFLLRFGHVVAQVDQ